MTTQATTTPVLATLPPLQRNEPTKQLKKAEL